MGSENKINATFKNQNPEDGISLNQMSNAKKIFP